jgi:CheY-like chemotaxis protein
MAQGAHPPRVLLVEDQADLRQLMALILRHAEYHVDAVASAGDALARLGTANYQIVVSDLRLGFPMTGVQLADAVRGTWPHIYFILVTGCAGSPDELEAERHGIDHVLIKPFSSSELREAVNRAASRIACGKSA